MSVFAEMDFSADTFALTETLKTRPEAVIEIERVVASEKLLTPYFWVTNVSADEFETAAETDSSVRDVRRLDTFEEANLFRAEWTENVESIVYAYTEVGGVILDATGYQHTWEVQLRFDDRDQLRKFQSFCADSDIEFTINRLFEVSHPHTGRQFGLTEKQRDALVKAWEAGVFESPAESTLAEVADDLDISQQALSQRIRNGHNSLIANTLVTEPPTAD